MLKKSVFNLIEIDQIYFSHVYDKQPLYIKVIWTL